MKKFFSGKKIIIIFATVFVAIGLIIGSSFFYNRSNSVPFIQRFENDVVSFFSKGVSSPAAIINKSTDSLGQLFQTYRQNQKIQSKIDQLAQQKIEINNLLKENQELKKNLELKGTLTDYQTVDAVVIQRAPTFWQSVLVINKGSNDGVKKNAPVMSNKGLIGKVVQVSNISSKVLLISNISLSEDRFSVSMQAENQPVNSDPNDPKMVNGVISGYDVKTNTLYMDELTSDESVAKGTIVQTSGLGGIIPKGIYVGTVKSVKENSSGVAKRIYITPSANLDSVENVLVVIKSGKMENK
ncbi:MAG: rod shape-determining protein MreC [Lactobacillaceae bacterium]|jgi:rod shape-determining protein MreC|nr:rod shape-determining protein MreC [Lactobacillaceae bacterium]